ncbi:general secretion pathway protein K [Duganella sp. 1224]|uniref:type II secretion system minor pseudopilin GspK n=1 Tax=Duganella sp. 1224 TaxID=2587052 RepID=UPI0015C77C79|nr:type II secretion system minor pseudopilin GspK [Duganella sp. 1224]NYE63027.1 general secretion pathway protein K [Duganella sp. 1224]
MKLRRQRGVAVITALLLTTLAVTIVASLFWQQQVQVRSMENQRLQLQTRWILRGALDLSRLILNQDVMDSPNITQLNGVWATPLEETRLDDYVERERLQGENFDATLSGRMTDAQSRYNLANLAASKQVDPNQLAVFQKLLTNLRLDPGLAQGVADLVARSQTLPLQQKQATTDEPMELVRAEDLLAVSGFTPPAIDQLRDYVIVLPTNGTNINVNTAPAELLSALVPQLSLSEAAAMVNARKTVYYRQKADFTGTAQMSGKQVFVPYDVRSDYFLAYSRVKLDRATLETQALLARPGRVPTTTVAWIREY